MKHTPEPWSAFSDEPYELEIRSGDRRIAKVWLDDAPVHDYNFAQQANARRICAAVNACRGIGTETLERFDKEHAPENGFGLHRESKLESERDTYRDLCGELLKSLKNLEKRSGYMAHCCGFFTDDVVELVAARSSITKAEAVMGENSNG